MDETRYTQEVRPVVFKMLNALALYVETIGIGQDDMERAVLDWLNIRDIDNWRMKREK